jgi:ABC-2 type transport system permease protein
MSRGQFSMHRYFTMIWKEFIQMKRDRLTFAMLIGIPIIQLILFGYAINTNPKYLPTAVLSNDHSEFTRSFLQGLTNTEYFKIIRNVQTEQEARKLIATGEVLFVVTIPTDFTRNIIRNDHPSILIEMDATDPVATGSAIAAVNNLSQTVFETALTGSLDYLKSAPTPAKVLVHAKYNPENLTQYNVVPGLLGVVLTMTMVVITALAITRERERGTMENLLATPIQPLEVMLGKITPYIMVGYIQFTLILLAAHFLFAVPIQGSIVLLYFCALPFIAANLAVGLTFSTLAKNQLQALQMNFFFFLPSILLSGFIFPFAGMPVWAQWLGGLLPLTYFVRIARGIILKGNTLGELWHNIWPIFMFAIVVLSIAVKRFHKTLD